jgi:type IV pilus assembly protein PilE
MRLAAPTSPRRRGRGFTLIEVISVLAVIAILAAIAWPTYVQYVQRSNRSEARARLLEGAQWMQRFRTERGSFAGAGDALPQALREVRRGPQLLYAIAPEVRADGFRLVATPVDGGPMAADACGALALDETGGREFAATGSLRDCWGQ